MSIEASQLIANLGGRAAAHQIRKHAPVGTEYVAQYLLAHERITHYYDSRFRLYQDGHWAPVGVQQLASIKNNAIFSVSCELRAIHAALAALPVIDLKKLPSCQKCSGYLEQLTECRSSLTRQAEKNLTKATHCFWWCVFAVASVVLNIVLMVKAGQGWTL